MAWTEGVDVKGRQFFSKIIGNMMLHVAHRDDHHIYWTASRFFDGQRDITIMGNGPMNNVTQAKAAANKWYREHIEVKQWR